jgi:hypothetical protein
MSKPIKELKKQARKAAAVASATVDHEIAREMKTLAGAFRAQAKMLKNKKKRKNR